MKTNDRVIVPSGEAAYVLEIHGKSKTAKVQMMYQRFGSKDLHFPQPCIRTYPIKKLALMPRGAIVG